ncbi:MAG: GNAT family N-acetyltransferase [Paracoccaceae bacterium]
MTEAEAAAAAAIHAAAFAGRERGWSPDEIRALAERPGAVALLSEAAFLLGVVAAGEAELLTLAVRPSARRRGAARRLLAGFRARAAALGAETAFLEVGEDNRAARALYAADGWREAGRRRGYYALSDGSRVDAMILRRELGRLDNDHDDAIRKFV